MEGEIWDELGDLGQALFGNDNNATAAGDVSNSAAAAGDAFFEDDDFFKEDAIHDDDTCKWILHYRIAYLRVRAWDLLLFLPSVSLLSYLLLNLQSARQKLRATSNSAIFRTFHLLVFLSTAVATLRCLVAMAVHAEDPDNDTTDKILWILARFVFLLVELGILGLSLSIGHLGHTGVRNIVLAGGLVAAAYTSLQAYLEFNSPYYGNTVLRSGFEMYGQGGPAFWLTTSILLLFLYLAVFLLPFWPCCRPLAMMLPQPLLFYGYLCGHLLLNLTASIGTVLLLANRPAGMCVTNAATYVYFGLMPGLAFLCFVRPWLRVSQPNLLLSYPMMEGEDGEGGSMQQQQQHGSVHSLVELPETSIIKQTGTGFVNTPIFSAGILSPDSAGGEEGFLISTS